MLGGCWDIAMSGKKVNEVEPVHAIELHLFSLLGPGNKIFNLLQNYVLGRPSFLIIQK